MYLNITGDFEDIIQRMATQRGNRDYITCMSPQGTRAKSQRQGVAQGIKKEIEERSPQCRNPGFNHLVMSWVTPTKQALKTSFELCRRASFREHRFRIFSL